LRIEESGRRRGGGGQRGKTKASKTVKVFE